MDVLSKQSESAPISQKDLKRREFILNGNILAVLIRFSTPLIALNLFSYIYGVIDIIVVADKSDKVLSAVVMADQLKTLFSALGSGLATSGGILVSRLIGRGDFDNARSYANTFMTVAAVIAVLFVAILLPCTTLVLKAAGFTQSLMAEGAGYFAVEVVIVGVAIFNSSFLSFEKCRGATTNVLMINVAVMAVKISLTLLFVKAYNLPVVWIAASTLFANLLITAYAVVNLIRRKYLFSYSIKNTSFKGTTLKPYFKVALPIFLGSFVLNMGKVIINKLGTKYDEAAPGALGVSNQVGGSVTTMTSATEGAISMVVSQNVGAGNTQRALKAFWVALAIDITISLVGVTVLYFISDWLAGFFSQNAGDEQKQRIASIFSYEIAGIPFLGVNAACMGLIYGLGYTKLSLVFNISRLVVIRIPVVLIMLYCFYDFGPAGLGLGMMISNVGIGIISFTIAMVCCAKIKKNGIKDKL